MIHRTDADDGLMVRRQGILLTMKRSTIITIVSVWQYCGLSIQVRTFALDRGECIHGPGRKEHGGNLIEEKRE